VEGIIAKTPRGGLQNQMIEMAQQQGGLQQAQVQQQYQQQALQMAAQLFGRPPQPSGQTQSSSPGASDYIGPGIGLAATVGAAAIIAV